MTGEPKPGLYRDMGNGEVRFFRIYLNAEDVLTIIELVHLDNMAQQVKDSKRPLDADTWAKLVTWQ